MVILCLEIINLFCLLMMSFCFVLSWYWRTSIWGLVGQMGYDPGIRGNYGIFHLVPYHISENGSYFIDRCEWYFVFLSFDYEFLWLLHQDDVNSVIPVCWQIYIVVSKSQHIIFSHVFWLGLNKIRNSFYVCHVCTDEIVRYLLQRPL